jgi:hypothetical protein
MFTTEDVALAHLQPHPRNYRAHPDDEISHLMESIQANGVYRNVVVAQDGRTILAGHGVVEAASRLGLETLPVYRVEYGKDDPRALKLLVSDNEISHLAEVDDRALTELLRELQAGEAELLGTGYDEAMLANLLFVTRPASEIRDLDAAAQWVGMPDYDEGPGRIQLLLNFMSEEDRAECCGLLGVDATAVANAKTGRGWSVRWPVRPYDDSRALAFTAGEGDDDDE